MSTRFSSPLCFICLEQTDNPALSSSWNQERLSSTLCELLRLEPDVFKTAFENSTYCDSCLNDIHDAVMLMKSVSAIQDRISDVRTKFSTILMKHIELWLLGDPVESVEASRNHTPEGQNQTLSGKPGGARPSENKKRKESIMKGLKDQFINDRDAFAIENRSLGKQRSAELQSQAFKLVAMSKTRIVREKTPGGNANKQSYTNKSPSSINLLKPSTFISAYCTICHAYFTPSRWKSHPNTKRHIENRDAIFS